MSKRKALYLLLALFLYMPSWAQTDKEELWKLVRSIERVGAAHSDSVVFFAQKAMPLALKQGDLAAETRIQTQLATYTYLGGHFDSAVAIGIRMVRKAEQHPPHAELATLYYELSGIYGKNNYNDISGRYIRKGLELALLLNNDEVRADGYNRYGIYCERSGDMDSALYYYQMALDVNDRIGNLLGKSYSLENIAGIYQSRKDMVKSLFYLKQSMAYKERLGNKIGLAIVYMNVAEAYAETGAYDSSIKYTHKVQAITTEIGYKELGMYSYKFLAGVYERRGDLKSALAYYQRASGINDSIFNETKTKQLAEFNTKYETEKKEQQIKTLNQQTQIQSLQIRQRNIFIFAGTILVIIAVVLVWLAYNRRKLKEQAALQMAINKQQEITAREVIYAEERERRRIAADLHDGVGQLLSAALMNLNNLFNKTEMNAASKTLATHSVALVTESYDELRQISHQMIPNTLLKAGLASAVKDMIMRIDQSKMSISLEATGLNERLDEEIETVLYRVIQESVNNVIKHAKASKLNIQLVRDDEGVAITIEDNGNGFDMKQKDKGIGLKNMLSRVQFHKGTIDIDSSPGKGTLVAVFIPLNG